MRYIAVFHNWFVSGRGYEVIEMDVDSEDEAFEKASAHAYKCQSTGNKCSFEIIRIEDTETIFSKRREARLRKLTLKERILGRIE